MDLELSGVFAALITPVDLRGRPDFQQVDLLIDFVMERGVDGLCIGGGTSEYPHFDLDERKRLISHTAKRLRGSGHLISAVGASSFPRVKQLAEHAASSGSTALLVPPPHFYPYEQRDLAAFYREVARAADIPCLIYNLPSFTQPLELTTIEPLLREVANLSGVKDSSGERIHLKRLHGLRAEGREINLLCGSDELFLPALQAGWDGSISGLASCCPELLTAIYRRFQSGDTNGANRAHELLHEFAEHVLTLPFPWGIRIANDVRGVENGPLAIPPSPGREEQIAELKQWLGNWFSEHLADLAEGAGQ